MKKIFKTTMAFVAAVSLLSLAGCSKAEKEDINPTFDGEAVKTQFSIAMPSQLKSKMSYATVQGSEDKTYFRGMSDIVIIPYLSATDRTTRLGDNITLMAGSMAKPTLAANTAANSIPNGELLANNNAVLFNDVTIPLRTSGFLFFGKATGADGYANGYLNATGLGNDNRASDIRFTPVRIKESLVTTKGEALVSYVNSIAAATAAAEDPIAALAWADCANVANNAHPWYSASLGQLYTNFVSLKPAASSYVLAAVQDLYSSVFAGSNKVALAIKAAILASAYVSDTNNDGVLEITDDLKNYPGGDNNFMPDGSAAMQWSEPEAPATYKQAVLQTSATNNDMTQDMEKIVYPASLWYTADCGLKAAKISLADEYKTDNATWDAILAKYTADAAKDGAGTAVTAATRSVAINDPIEYAVGRLDSKVNALSSEAYYDRKGVAVAIPTAGFQLTGVLIGGQKAVDYQFAPTGSDIWTIYDKEINANATASDQNGAVVYDALKVGQNVGYNYTLALPTAANEAVYVAFEFQNGTADDATATDFWGVDGVVKKGCKFYMIAQLAPNAATGVTGYDADDMNQVFKADHKTIANVTIAHGVADANGNGVVDVAEGDVAGFANAYVTIPDLRTPQLELGFSVDLSWQSGLTFEIEF